MRSTRRSVNFPCCVGASAHPPGDFHDVFLPRSEVVWGLGLGSQISGWGLMRLMWEPRFRSSNGLGHRVGPGECPPNTDSHDSHHLTGANHKQHASRQDIKQSRLTQQKRHHARPHPPHTWRHPTQPPCTARKRHFPTISRTTRDSCTPGPHSKSFKNP